MNNKQKRSTLRILGIIIWVSFVSAAGATMIFFSMFDPETLGYITTWPVSLDRIGGYSIGFLLFWLFAFITSSFTAWLMSVSQKKLEQDTFIEGEDDYDDSAYE